MIKSNKNHSEMWSGLVRPSCLPGENKELAKWLLTGFFVQLAGKNKNKKIYK
jgi:hypothetical protein